MGFYGKVTNRASSQFVFDKFYKTRLEMDNAVSTDGVFVGRRVLVNYEEVETGIQREYTLWELESVESETTDGKTKTYGIFKKSDDEYATTADALDAGLSIIKIAPDHSGDEYTQDSYWLVNAEEDKFELLTLADQSEDYYVNYQIDNREYGTSRGYDSTVWEKTNVDGKLKYVMIAELNSVVPTFDVSADAPTQEPIKPHFDADSTNVYYKLHTQPNWGMRVAAADGSGSVLEKQESDSKTERWTPHYEIDSTSGLAKITYDIDEVDGAIYFNKAGFDPEIRSKIEEVEDGVKVTPTGISGNKYNLHDGTNKKVALPDIQEISVNLPSIGNAISDVWDLVYGEERNLDVLWQSKDGLRLIQENPEDEDKKSGFTYSMDIEKTHTVAGAINSLHDAIGDMVIEEPDIADTETINVKNIKMTRNEDGDEVPELNNGYQIHDDNIVNDSDFNHIYYYNNQFYRKHINYELIPYEGNPYENEDNLYERAFPSNDYYWYYKAGNYIKESVNEPSKVYYNVNPTLQNINFKYEPEKYYVIADNNKDYILLTDENTNNKEIFTIKTTNMIPFLPQTYEEIEDDVIVSQVPRFWYIEGSNQTWNQSAARPITITNWRELDANGNPKHPSSKFTYFQYVGVQKIETVYDPERGAFVTRSYWVLEDEAVPQVITNAKEWSLAFTPETANGVITKYAGIVFNSNLTGDELQREINSIDLDNTKYVSLATLPTVVYESGKFYTFENDSYFLARKDYEDYEEGTQFYTLRPEIIGDNASLSLYEPNKFYYKDAQGKYDLDAGLYMTEGREYYMKKRIVVYSDETNTYNIGHEWLVNSESLPNGLVLGWAKQYFDWEILPRFSRTLNSAFGLILKLNDMLQMNDQLTRDESTLQGSINLLKDIITRFTTLHVGDIMLIDDYGRIHGTTHTTAQPFRAVNNGLTDAVTIPSTSNFRVVRVTERHYQPNVYYLSDEENGGFILADRDYNPNATYFLSIGEDNESRWITYEVDPDVVEPKITVRHEFTKVNDTTTTADKNSDGDEGNGLNKTHGDTIDLYTPIVDAMGHVVGKNTETVTLPYSYKTITTTGLSEEVGDIYTTIAAEATGKNTDTKALGDATNETIADNTQDTTTLDPANKWIQIKIEDDSISIGHEVHSVNTEAQATNLNSDSVATTDAAHDNIVIQDIVFDEAGHVTQNRNHTYTLPYGFKTITTNGRVNSTITNHPNTTTLGSQSNIVAENTQDTLGINSGDAWTKITTNANGDTITISHDVLAKTTSTSTQDLSTEIDSTTTFDVVTYGFDATNHHSTTDTKTIIMPNSYGKFTGDTGSSEATATHDTFAVNGDNWLTSTVETDKITLTHDDANVVANRNPENKTPKFGETFTIEDWRFDSKGHMYGGAESHTVTIPKGSLTQTTAKTNANVLTTISFVDSTGAITVDRANVGSLLLTDYNAAPSGVTLTDDVAATDSINKALAKVQYQLNALDSATHFRGIVNALSDITDPAEGDIIYIKDTTAEYIYYNNTWNKLGDESIYVTKTYATVAAITPATSETITSISQENGKIAVSKSSISIASNQVNDKTNSYSANGELLVTGKAVAEALTTIVPEGESNVTDATTFKYAADHTQDIANANNAIAADNMQITTKQGSITANNNAIANNNTTISELQSDITDLENTNNDLQSDISNIELSIQGNNDRIAEIEASLEDPMLPEEEIPVLEEERNGLDQDNEDLRAQIIEIQGQMATNTSAIGELQSEISSLQSANSGLSSSNTRLQNEIASLQADITAKQNNIQTWNQEEEEAPSYTIQELARYIKALENRIAVLESK